jgi:hypothetical protein
MTSQVLRLYAAAIGLLVFLLVWAAIAAHPWKPASAGRDPRLAALAARELRLRRDAVAVRRVVARRLTTYHAQLRVRRREIAAAHRRQLAQRAVQATAAPVPLASSAGPSVRIVTLPPLTITRTS